MKSLEKLVISRQIVTKKKEIFSIPSMYPWRTFARAISKGLPSYNTSLRSNRKTVYFILFCQKSRYILRRPSVTNLLFIIIYVDVEL